MNWKHFIKLISILGHILSLKTCEAKKILLYLPLFASFPNFNEWARHHSLYSN
ncbi:hypothetical protein FLAVO9AF_230125 [Flavobacterium sp. 9AF]|nr:hypothetical protein FLAVO9AF_230125 [Flavobacterium sp. 9AF]